MQRQKILVVLGDGMADEPLEELGGKTPLEYARTPHFDRIAGEGACGLLRTIPPGFEAGSDIANLSILGYDPARYYTGRGPLEAASIGVELGADSVAYRCNLVTVTAGVMEDFTAGHVSSDEGARLIRSLEGSVEGARFYPGVSYRNLLVLERGKGAETTPPHDIAGQPIETYLPLGWDGPILRKAIQRSRTILADHEVNRDRIVLGREHGLGLDRVQHAKAEVEGGAARGLAQALDADAPALLGSIGCPSQRPGDTEGHAAGDQHDRDERDEQPLAKCAARHGSALCRVGQRPSLMSTVTVTGSSSLPSSSRTV